MNDAPRVILASQSPRRAQLLAEAGFTFEQRSPAFTDPDQPPRHLRGHEAEDYAASLAEQKAASLAKQIDTKALILAADTICVDAAGDLVGKPRDRAHAAEMIRSFIEAEHRVLTGVALLRLSGYRAGQAHAVTAWASESHQTSGQIESFTDTAVVRFDVINEEQIDAYLATDGWRGKAGGYNLFDRQAAGWPIEVEGDPTTVVGLPMRRLVPLLEGFARR